VSAAFRGLDPRDDSPFSPDIFFDDGELPIGSGIDDASPDVLAAAEPAGSIRLSALGTGRPILDLSMLVLFSGDLDRRNILFMIRCWARTDCTRWLEAVRGGRSRLNQGATRTR
jgi:hypothetical protein